MPFFLLVGMMLVAASDAATTPVLWIGVEADRPRIETLAPTVAAQLRELEVPITLTWLPERPADLSLQLAHARDASRKASPALLAVVWIDEIDKSSLDLYVYEPKTDHLLVRTLALSSERSREHAEAVAVILRAAAQALLAGGTIGIESTALAPLVDLPPPPSPLPPPVPLPRTPATPPRPSTPTKKMKSRELELSARVAYGADYAGDPSLISHGLSAQAELAPWSALAVVTGLRLNAPLVIETPHVRTRLRRLPLELGALARIEPFPWLRLAAGTSAMVDFLRQTTEAKVSGVLPIDDESRWAFGFVPFGQAEAKLYGPVFFFARLQLPVWVQRPLLAIQGPATNEVVYELPLVEPGGMIGLSAEIL